MCKVNSLIDNFNNDISALGWIALLNGSHTKGTKPELLRAETKDRGGTIEASEQYEWKAFGRGKFDTGQ